MSRLKEFREFINSHPTIKTKVEEGNFKWQKVYEDWVILGPNDTLWNDYKDNSKKNDTTSNSKEEGKKDFKSAFNMKDTSEIFKTVYGYVKKINTDQVVKTLGNAQKVMGLVQGFIGGGLTGAGLGSKKSTGDPLFDKKFDEWY